MFLSFPSGLDLLRYSGGKSLPTVVLCWQQNLVLALKELIKAWAGWEGDGFILRRAGAMADKLQGAFFSISVVSCKWSNDPAAGPGFTLAACKQVSTSRWVRIHKMRRAGWMCHTAETCESPDLAA